MITRLCYHAFASCVAVFLHHSSCTECDEFGMAEKCHNVNTYIHIGRLIKCGQARMYCGRSD